MDRPLRLLMRLAAITWSVAPSRKRGFGRDYIRGIYSNRACISLSDILGVLTWIISGIIWRLFKFYIGAIPRSCRL